VDTAAAVAVAVAGQRILASEILTSFCLANKISTDNVLSANWVSPDKFLLSAGANPQLSGENWVYLQLPNFDFTKCHPYLNYYIQFF
jgi:hypothetical protein